MSSPDALQDLYPFLHGGRQDASKRQKALLDSVRLKAAVIRTFDGQHPCSLCREIERGRKSEGKPAQTVEMAKLVLIYQPTAPCC